MSSRKGMRNLGNTYYLNVAIQGLLSLSCLQNLLKHVKQPYPPVIQFLMDCFSLTESNVLSPNVVYHMYLSLHNNRRNMPEDAVECFLRLTQYIENNITSTIKIAPPQKNYCACDLFWQNQNDLTLVKEHFFGVLYSRMRCSRCNKTKTKFETFQVLPIHSNLTNSVSDGLIRLTNSSETIDSVDCDNCKNKNTFVIDQTSHRLPRVLMFEIIGRSEEFRFDEILIIQHTHGQENDNITYRLKTLFLYSGSHYNCISYDPVAKIYFIIDDENVSPVSLSSNVSLRFLIYEVVSSDFII